MFLLKTAISSSRDGDVTCCVVSNSNDMCLSLKKVSEKLIFSEIAVVDFMPTPFGFNCENEGSKDTVTTQ
jgi:hypothetical protein